MVTALLWIVLLGAPSDAADAGSATLRFADSLRDAGEIDRAITEYYRFRFEGSDPAEDAEAMLRIADCERRLGHVDLAIRALRVVTADETAPSPLRDRAVLAVTQDRMRLGEDREAILEAEHLATGTTEPEIARNAWAAAGWGRARLEEWAPAAEAFERAGAGRTAALVRDRGPRLRRRSPKVAGALSAVLPGLGHLYAGRPGDAATAFLLNGAFIAASVEAFRSDQDALGGALGLFEVGWYLGNVYTAVGAAHRGNSAARGDLLAEIRPVLEEEVPPKER